VDVAQYPSAARGWTLTALLTAGYILSYVDRSILGALIQPIKADLHISDLQIGLLIGLAFGLFYAVIGVPLGWLADRARRTWIVAAGVTLWSAATMASGLAGSFGHLFLARMGVGVGEAALSPCAMSLIGDSFPPERRGKPVGVYSTALALGAGLSSLIVAAVLGAAHGQRTLAVPMIGTLQSWQFAFLLVGLPGLIIAPLFLIVREPQRHAVSGTARPAWSASFAHVAQHLGALGGVTLLAMVMTTIAYSQQFGAAAFARTFGWDARAYLQVNGVISLFVGPLTVIGIGAIADYWRKRGVRDAPFRLLVAGYLLMIPSSAAALMMPAASLAFIVGAFGTIGIGTVTAAAIIALLDVTPSAIRGQTVALYYMAISMSGLLLGPPTVGFLSSRVFGETHLRLAISAVPLIYGLVPLLLIPMIRRRYAAELERSGAAVS
jgi:MFS family permease